MNTTKVLSLLQNSLTRPSPSRPRCVKSGKTLRVSWKSSSSNSISERSKQSRANSLMGARVDTMWNRSNYTYRWVLKEQAMWRWYGPSWTAKGAQTLLENRFTRPERRRAQVPETKCTFDEYALCTASLDIIDRTRGPQSLCSFSLLHGIQIARTLNSTSATERIPLRCSTQWTRIARFSSAWEQDRVATWRY